jgi:hypothetical protein
MGIRFSCPNGHKLNVKDNLAGKRGICPACGARFVIPAAGESTSATGQVAVGATTATQSAATSGATASASVVIAVADEPATSAPATAPAAPAAPVVQVQASPPPKPTAPAVTPAPSAETPLVVTDAAHPVAAVSKYTAHRMRSRRLQTTIAIGLLIAVVVLGIVLIVVLSRGTGTTTQSTSASMPTTPIAAVRRTAGAIPARTHDFDRSNFSRRAAIPS